MDTVTPLLLDEDVRRWRQCDRWQWLHRQAPQAETPLPNQAQRAEAAVVGGPAPGEALAASYPGARLISPVDADRSDPAFWTAALARTAEALNENPPRPLIGACLAEPAQGLLARIDLMLPGSRGWRLVRVRHATAGDEIDVDQLALWAELAERRGLPVSALTLALINTDFLYPGHGLYAGLYREVDLSEGRLSRSAWNWPAELRRLVGNTTEPTTPRGPQCLQPVRCPCIAHCSAGAASADAGDAAPATADTTAQSALESLGRDLAAQLRDEGHHSLLDVPLARLREPRHQRVWRAVHEQHLVVDPGAAAALQALPGPRHFLRFETIGFAVPLWPGTRPYQVLPFQWSLTVQAAPGAPLQHQHFLARPQDGDPRRAFATRLLAAVGTQGPLLAYNAGFERNRLRELAMALDDLAAPLEALQARIVDLFQLARGHLYHPAMAGSWSARSVFDAIAPELHCGQFEVDGCHSPLAAFALSLRRHLDPATAQALQAALVDHGQRLTLALLRLSELLEAPGHAAP